MGDNGTAGRADTGTDFAALIAGLLVEMLGELGTAPFPLDEVRTEGSIRNRDLVELGLGSLDWIRLALRVGEETGLELPEEVLVDAGRRTVASWAEALLLASCPTPGTNPAEPLDQE
ncbi:acyl carrier protein [Streptacidiphilus sp. PB12-B1b]|uniref:acyl carrier protein n=1 Tax=Streptacidiphilus sp. PB12-B1b TaxID=2705012 RepID=UPI0015FE09EB|nr:acyl carrier protein [Streptacidiphilus sp. PB12-B1b]QMU74632.1 acyl carrier protein [Streptacidiphilus sp. PB12-B1b]